jgi:hypothetical protein
VATRADSTGPVAPEGNDCDHGHGEGSDNGEQVARCTDADVLVAIEPTAKLRDLGME